MFHHISIAAENPAHVAEVLAEIFQGQMAPFPPHPGSYMALALDQHGTMIEVYPAQTELRPSYSDEGVTFTHNPSANPFSATHCAISVPVEQAQIEAIAAREGWKAVRCNRDNMFEVIEFWVENRLLVELLTPSMAPRYLALMNPQNLQQNLEQFIAQSTSMPELAPA